MKKFIGLMIFIAAFGLSPTVSAVETTGKVLDYTPTKYHVFLFTVSNKTSPVACDSTARYAIPTDEAWGRVAIAAVIAAKATGNTVKVTGENACSYWSNSEDMAYMDVQ